MSRSLLFARSVFILALLELYDKKTAMKWVSKQLLFVALAIAVPLFAACNYRKARGNDGSLGSNLSFSSSQLQFQNIFNTVIGPKCVDCHGNKGNVNLESYSAILANLAGIQRAVFSEARMPPPTAAALTVAERSLLQAWLDAGAPEFAPDGPALTPPVDTAPPTGGGEPIPPQFAAIQEKIFVPKCVECHKSGGKAESVPLDTLADLLNPQNGDDPYVVAGLPEESRLWVVTNPALRRRMPPASSSVPPLTLLERKAIEDWIRNGAKD